MNAEVHVQNNCVSYSLEKSEVYTKSSVDISCYYYHRILCTALQRRGTTRFHGYSHMTTCFFQFLIIQHAGPLDWPISLTWPTYPFFPPYRKNFPSLSFRDFSFSVRSTREIHFWHSKWRNLHFKSLIWRQLLLFHIDCVIY